MTLRLSQAVAAALAASAVSLAFAQSEPQAANPPKSNGIPQYLANLHFAQEPIARPVKAGDDDPLVGGIVTALNNDGSLQGSKITVSSQDGVVTLTGATMTPDQKAKVDQIAVAQAGEGKVINTVLDSIT